MSKFKVGDRVKVVGYQDVLANMPINGKKNKKKRVNFIKLLS